MPSKQERRKEPVEPLDTICFHIGRVYYNYVGTLERLLAEAGLGKRVRPGMGHILFELFREDDRIIKDIAERVQLGSSTMSGLLNSMVKAGLVTRRKDSADGRAVRVRLTPLGRSVKGRCHEVLAQINAIIERGQDAERIELVKASLAKMSRSLREANPSRPATTTRS